MPDLGTGLSIGSSLLGGMMEGDAASDASGAQMRIAEGQTAETRRQFDAMRALLAPYVGAGSSALSQQMALLGLGGIPASSGFGGAPMQSGTPLQSADQIRASLLSQFTTGITPGASTGSDDGASLWGGLPGRVDEAGLQAAVQQQLQMQQQMQQQQQPMQQPQGDPRAMQAAAISQFENSPYFQAITKQSENAILQNASATGGLRGGNIQGALAGTRPILLQNLIDKQLANLSGLSAMGQNAAAGVGTAGMQAGQLVNQSQGAFGAAQAGGILGQGSAMTGALGNIGGVLASRFPSGVSAPPVVDGGYSIGQGSAYGGLRAGL